MQQRKKTTPSQTAQTTEALALNVRQTRAQQKAVLRQKMMEERLAYTLRSDEEIGYIDGCFDDSSDELAVLREFGL